MNYDYASLGNSCQISSDSLLNNTKYFPPNFPLYNVYITKMTNYPAGSHPDICNKKEDTKKEAIVSPDAEETEDTKKKESFTPYRSQVNYSTSCCGRK